MKKFVIRWNAGFGESVVVIDAVDIHGAFEEAYENWKYEAESNSDFRAEPLTPELAEDLDLEDYLDDED